MKKLLLILSLAFVASLSQAQDIASVVRSMPDVLMLKIDEGQKELLLDSDTTQVIVTNMLNGQIQREAFSKDYIKIKTSNVGSLQLKLLPLINNSYILEVVRTVCGRACDSQVEFYTTDWQPLNSSDLFPVIDKDSFIKSDVDRNSFEFKNAYSTLDMIPIKYILSPENQDVIVEFDIQQYLSTDDYKLIEPFLKNEPITLYWDKTSYKN